MKRPAAAVALLIAALLSACSDPERRVVAEAGGQRIYFRHLLQEAALARSRGVALDNPRTDTLARFYNQAVQRLVDEFLLAQEAERRGLRVPDSLLQAEVERFRAAHASGQDFERVLASYHMTEREFRDTLRRRLLVEQLAESLASGIRVSEAEVRAHYARFRTRYRVPARATLEVVWVSRTAADRALGLLRGGASAETTAKAVGGRSDRVEVVEGQFAPTVEAQVLGAGAGQVVGPFPFGSAAMVARVARVVPGRLKPFREARGDVEAELLRSKQEEALSRLARQLRHQRGYAIFVTFSGMPPPQPRPTRMP